MCGCAGVDGILGEVPVAHTVSLPLCFFCPLFVSLLPFLHFCFLPTSFLSSPSLPSSPFLPFSFPLDSLNSRCEDLSTYNQTLVEEKSQLTKMLSDAEQKISGSESWTRVQQLEQELREHQKLSQEQVGGV